ncbi:spore coat associated protein CotJA [Clostridium combesii]|uniref:Spore coat associated protein CotJA n=1 Tax=Clostridium combesii TaxID=39481 RepID=A0A2G7HL31_9CLOT|nr:spore coat associated protein CotJA [Clostridium combesii]PIH05820.1 spore coat associated protein CotJA [Clostridium combesii]
MKCAKDFWDCMEECELARAYICPQKFKRIYKVDKALKRGTLFPDLYRPYESSY